MNGLGALLVALVLQSPGAPNALQDQLTPGPSGPSLPLGFAREIAPEIQLVFHRQRRWSAAHYFPAEQELAPRLALYLPWYLRGLQLRPLAEMQVDVSEYFFHALLLAWLEGLPRDAEGSEGARLERRARELLVQVPPEYRREAYLDSLASFGSHALATALEIERKHHQRRQRGASLCRALRENAPLFRLWQTSFRHDPYRGAYWMPANQERGIPGEMRYAPQGLATEDKRWLVDEALGGRWSGDPEPDFEAMLCREAE